MELLEILAWAMALVQEAIQSAESLLGKRTGKQKKVAAVEICRCGYECGECSIRKGYLGC
jgi:hypothetical protein